MIRIFATAVLASLCAAGAAAAQDRMPSHCIALSQAYPGLENVRYASYGAPLAADTVRISYVDHATFLIETPGGVSAATDYTGYLGAADPVPDVATMNNTHGTHWTDRPDPRIPHVLNGWAEGGVPADHYLDLGEMLVRNVPTDVRGMGGTVRADGNSIFVFEAAGLCIGHLGHLHREPTPEEYALIGRLDVVMVPVDGGYTMPIEDMTRVLDKFRSRVILPMHWFGPANLAAFLDELPDDFAVERREENWIEMSLAALPDRPTVIVLSPSYID